MEKILRSPVDNLIGSLSHDLQGFIHARWLAGFLPSTVWGVFLMGTVSLK